METEITIPERFERLPVFPLPNTVLFPGTVLPLHVFEERYRQMIADILDADGWLAIVMLRDEGDPLESRPAIHDVACAGKLIHTESLDDGNYNVLVQGVDRVRLTNELDVDTPYRCFTAERLTPAAAQDLESASIELGRLQSCVLSLSALVEDKDEQLLQVLRATADPIKLADILGAAVVTDTSLQQRLLSTADVRSRLAMLVDGLAEVMVKVNDPPDEAGLN